MRNVDTGGGTYIEHQEIVYGGPPPDAETPRQHFEPEVVEIPAGPFLMGSDAGDGVPLYETPRHQVQLGAYSIGVYPVTNAQYAHYLRETRQIAPPELGWDGQHPHADQQDHPVILSHWPTLATILPPLTHLHGH